MSETIEVESPTQPQRRTQADRREERRERELDRARIELAPDAVTPEDALEDTARQLQERDQQLAQARQQAAQAEQRRLQAEAEARKQHAERHQDRQSFFAAEIANAQTEQEAAEQAWQLARDAGDLKAEIQAQKTLAAATQRMVQAQTQLDALKAAPAPPQPAAPVQQPTQAGPSEASQKWLNEHPRFFSDNEYRADAIASHHSALLAGHAEGSQSYVDYIDNRMNRLYPSEQQPSPRNDPPPRQNMRDTGSRGDGAPSSRHTGTSHGWKSVEVPTLGTIQYQDRSDGTRGIRFTSRNQQENFMEGAQITERRVYEQDPNKALALYANSQIDAVLQGAYREDFKVGDGRGWE